MVSNGTLEWSGGDAQPPQSSVVHLGPSVAGLGADFEMSIRATEVARRRRAAPPFPGFWTWALQLPAWG